MLGVVEPSGPVSSEVIWLGEAPGKWEVIKGEPFIGQSGDEVRKALRGSGVDVSKVRFTNCVRINPGEFPDGKLGAQLLKGWAHVLDNEFSELNEAKVLVLCGGQALRRVTGWTGIGDWAGSVLRPHQLPKEVVWYGSSKEVISHQIKLPPKVEYIIPTLHPAGILRDPSRSDLFLFRRQVEKVGLAVRDRLSKLEWQLKGEIPTVKGNRFAFDTEFNPETGEVYWVGFTFNGVDIYGLPWEGEVCKFVQHVLEDKDILKIAHNISADYGVLKGYGIKPQGPIYDTMIGMYVLHPGTEVGLSPTSRYYLDDVFNHKWMDKREPWYNGYDVYLTYWSWRAQLGDIKSRPVDVMSSMERRFKIIEGMDRLRKDGMLVNLDTRDKLIEEQRRVIEENTARVEGVVEPLWVKRQGGLKGKGVAIKEDLEKLKEQFRGKCKKHPRFMPSKRKGVCPTCTLMNSTNEARGYLEAVAEGKRKKSKLTKLGEFKFKSSHHVGWLLYSSEALNLPIPSRTKKTRKAATNADAIERLRKIKSVAKDKFKMEVLDCIKDIQGAEKAIATFLSVQIDSEGRVHPRYKVHGTTTGRIAGGADTKGEGDKIYNLEEINPLNIPDEWRKMYIAPPGMVIVMADWKNQEGRLMAWFSGDERYKEAFRVEDSGGVEVHSKTAHVIYGIDPQDSEKVEVRFGGGMYTARHCAKVARHAVSYSPMPVNTLMKNYQLDVKEASRIVEAMQLESPMLFKYKEQLVEEVLGKWDVWRGHDKERAVCTQPGRRWDSVPMGWMVYYFGQGKVVSDPLSGQKVAMAYQAGEAIAFRQQAMGAEMWAECEPQVRERYQLMTGTYDSFYPLVEDSSKAIDKAIRYLKEVMERKWVDGMEFPVDVKVGYNLGKYVKGVNEGGLRKWVS